MGLITSQATATIAAGQSLSAAIYLGAKLLASIQMPAAWTPAVLSFQGSIDGVTYTDVYDTQGVEYSIVAAQATLIPVPDEAFKKGLLYLKIRSGLTAAPIAQVAAAAIQCMTRRP